jgi:hypothetical protein
VNIPFCITHHQSSYSVLTVTLPYAIEFYN